MKTKLFIAIMLLLTTIGSQSFTQQQIVVIPANLTVRLKFAQDVRFNDLQVGKPIPCTVIDDVVYDQIIVIRSGATASAVVDGIDCEGRKKVVRFKGQFVQSRDRENVRLTDQSVKVADCCDGKAETNTEIVTTTGQAFKIRI